MRPTAGYSAVAAVAGGRVRARVCLPRAVRPHFAKVSIILDFLLCTFFTAFFFCEFTMF